MPSDKAVQPDNGVTIPADIERPDKILAGLTGRQLAILVPVAALVWVAFLAIDSVVPLLVFAAFAIPVLGAAAALALAERDGLSLDRLLLHALARCRRPRRLVLAPDGVAPLPAWATARTTGRRGRTGGKGRTRVREPVAALRLPAHALRADGAFDLGEEGVAVVVACSTVSFALRTPGEQAALVGAFGAWLNSLQGPVQILVHAAPVNLNPTITTLRERAAGLPHPRLEDAALDHAHYLAELAATKDLLARRVLLVLREPHGAGAGMAGRDRDADGAAARALRRAEQAVRALAACQITATVLDASAATAALTAAADPSAPPAAPGEQAAPGEPVTAHTPTHTSAPQTSQQHQQEGQVQR